MSSNDQSHHILPVKTILKVGGTLLCLTAVTVWVAQIDLGRFNFLIAMVVATVKALLVVLFFMNLKNDSHENAVMFGASFIFLLIFITFTSTDIFFRGNNVYVTGPLMMEGAGSQNSKYKKPWESTPELISHGKELFAVQCISCHGVEGKGDGPAAASLSPPPRNFHVSEGWKNGRRATMVFKTLKEGLPPSAMASYATLPVDDRWALTHYVLSLSGAEMENSAEDFAKAGLDPSKDGGGGEKVAPSIPLDVAMDRLSLFEGKKSVMFHAGLSDGSQVKQTLGGGLYLRHCASCHGLQGQGGIKTQAMGGSPMAYVVTQSFQEESYSSDDFKKIVREGLPGSLMPGFGQLSDQELNELFRYTQSLKESH